MALGLAALTAWQANRLGAERAALVALARDAGLGARLEETERRLRREPDPAQGRLALARALVAVELDATHWRGLSSGELERALARGAERLQLAERLAREALTMLPASWEGPLILGTASFLQLAGSRDTQLFERPTRWTAPLELAAERGPAFHEAGQMLSAGYLEIWPALGSGARQHARGLLRDAFIDRATFDRLFPAWAAIARTRRELYDPLPDRTEVWQRVMGHHAASREWEGYLDAASRFENARGLELERRLSEARARLRGGDITGARTAFVALARDLRPGLDDAPRFEASLNERPAGAIGDALASAARLWLPWAQALCLVRSCPLDPAAVERLVGTAVDLEPTLHAFGLLVGGNLPAAELIERRTEAQWSEAWAPFLVLKARRLATAGDLHGASLALGLVHRNWRERLPVLLAQRALATAGVPGLALARAEEQLALARHEAWEPTDWLWQGEKVRLELLPARSAHGLALAFDEVPPTGAIVALQWNGRALPLRVVTPAAPLIILSVEIAAEPGLLQVESVAGGHVRPGRVELR